MTNLTTPIDSATYRRPTTWMRLRANVSVLLGGWVLMALVILAIAAPVLGTVDPILFDATNRDLLPSDPGEITDLDGNTTQRTFWLGADSYVRDIYSRVVYGARVSLLVGIAVSIIGLSTGLCCGLIAGYFRALDGLIIHIMDGLMAIPGILLAIALVALWKATIVVVVVAIAIPEIPRVTRLVRALVLTIREEPYVEAAIAVGTGRIIILYRHILPNCMAPLIV